MMKCPTCPLCSQPPRVLLSQLDPPIALCGNEECEALIWNPAVSLDDNLTSAQRLPDIGDET